ncbi:MAG: GntR family transcriptional regulator [Gammaproteobacteria bacterium]|nr:GntR family transcriptional regulator [Gammaproteobacteria bacterium]
MPQALTDAAPAKTLTDSVYQRIRNDIVDGHLEPDSKLRIEHLRKIYGVGATPIREALSRLSSDGFVHNEGQRGFRVSPISVADLKEITDLRIMLELRALHESITNGDEDWEANLVTAFFRLSKTENNKDEDDPTWDERREARNSEFHEALLSACRSRWLLRFYRIIYDQHKRYRTISLAAVSMAQRNPHDEHQRIYDAALARDADTACKEIKQHILRTAEISLAFIKEHMLLADDNATV